MSNVISFLLCIFLFYLSVSNTNRYCTLKIILLMNILINASITLGVLCFMECFTWFFHKHVMHGFMWFLHRDHHDGENHLLEKNDFFFLIFAIPSWLLIMFGMMAGNDYRVWVGLGIGLYGAGYIFGHEIIAHSRFRFTLKTKSPWLVGMKKGHDAHHELDGPNDQGRHGCRCFGILYSPWSFYKEAADANKS